MRTAVLGGSGRTGRFVVQDLVRPPRLTGAPATGRVEHHAHTSPRRTAIGRADLAAFVAGTA